MIELLLKISTSNHLCWSLIITYINELLEDISHGKLNVVGLEEDWTNYPDYGIYMLFMYTVHLGYCYIFPLEKIIL